MGSLTGKAVIERDIVFIKQGRRYKKRCSILTQKGIEFLGVVGNFAQARRNRMSRDSQFRVKQELLNDEQRFIATYWGVSQCEGKGFIEHKCNTAMYELNHVIYPKNMYQKMSNKDKEYFDHKFNCALNCHNFHERYGHTRKYRRWHIERVSKIYGGVEVLQWMQDAPFKENPYHAEIASSSKD